MSRFFKRTVDAESTNGKAASTPASTSASSSSSLRNLDASAASTSSLATSNANPPTPHLILRPHPSVQLSPLPPPSAEEAPVVARLRSYVDSLILSHYYHSDGTTPRAAGSLDDEGKKVEPWYEKWEKRWLDNEPQEWTIRRYLKASGGKEQEAKRRLKKSLDWRRERKPDVIKPEYVRPESTTGKHLYTGFDNEGRPLLHLRPALENCSFEGGLGSRRQIDFLCFGLERTLDLLPPGQTKLALLIDFHQASSGTSPGFATQREVLQILQDHYVERLGVAFVMRPPLWMNILFKALGPFIDPVTRSKVKWSLSAEELQRCIPAEQLLVPYGGRYNFEFEKDVFWREILEFTGVDEGGGRKHESLARCGVEEEERVRREGRGRLRAGDDVKEEANGHAQEGENDDDDDDDDFADAQDAPTTPATTAAAASAAA